MLSLYLALLQDVEDKPIFTEFYEKYKKLVFYVAKKCLQNSDLAEDCSQETFIKLAKNFHNIKPFSDDVKIEHYIKIVTKHTAIDIYRKEKKHLTNLVELDVEDFYSIAEETFDVCDEMTLKQAIDSLPEEIKMVFYLKYVYNYSGAEISKLLGISEPLVRKRCMLGMRKAKEFIESE